MVHTHVDHTVNEQELGQYLIVPKQYNLKCGAEAAQAQDTVVKVAGVTWLAVDQWVATTVVEHYLDRPDALHQDVFTAGVLAQAATVQQTTVAGVLLHVAMHQEDVWHDLKDDAYVVHVWQAAEADITFTVVADVITKVTEQTACVLTDYVFVKSLTG